MVFKEGKACNIVVNCKLKKLVFWKKSKLNITIGSTFLGKENHIIHTVTDMFITSNGVIFVDVLPITLNPGNVKHGKPKRMNISEYCRLMYGSKIKDNNYDIIRYYKYIRKVSEDGILEDIIMEGDHVVIYPAIKSKYNRQLGKVMSIVIDDQAMLFKMGIYFKELNKSVLITFNSFGFITYSTDNTLTGVRFDIERRFVED